MTHETAPGRPAHSRLRFRHFSALIGAVCLVAGLTVGGPVFAGDERLQLAQGEMPDWQKKCQDGRCAVSRAMFDPDSKKRVAALTFLFEEGQTGSVLVMAAPLGVAIKPGMQLVTGENTIDVPIQVCLPDGCQGTHRLTEVELSRIGALGSVAFRYFPFGKADKPLSATIPMDGLSETIEGLAIR